MDKIKVRFHLAQGEHHMHWQVKHPDGIVEYHNPEKSTLILMGCKLKNQRSGAEQIFEGAHKFVVAWIECDKVIVERHSGNALLTEAMHFDEVKYNPRKNPFWECDGKDVDSKSYPLLISEERKLYKS
jgi:hypothetical protein